MNTLIEQTRSAFPSGRQALAVLLAGVILLAFAGGTFLLMTGGWGHEVTHEDYYYWLFVRMLEPETSVELWIPTPDFTELQGLISVDPTWASFPGRNVTQSIEQTAYGSMFRFVFSESFAISGSVRTASVAGNGTLTFSSQVSNDVWIHLANISSGNHVSFILYYEVRQATRSFDCSRTIFVGTADPRDSFQSSQVLDLGYLGTMVDDNNAYSTLSAGWASYSLIVGGFAFCGIA